MKKILSVFLVVALSLSAMLSGSVDANANTVCTEHIYTNSCDTNCNNCNATREYKPHTHSECFIGYEENISTVGGWKKSCVQTGVYSIDTTKAFNNLTRHYIVVTDENAVEVKYNEKNEGWPLISNHTYTIRLKQKPQDIALAAIDFKLTKKADTLFPDTFSGQWYSTAIIYATGTGIMSGYRNGKFGTCDSIQRQDFLVMLARLDGVDLTKYENDSQFPDVGRGGYYESAINWGVENKIVNGYDNGNFGVGDTVTREQLVTFLYRYAEHKRLDVTVKAETKSETISTYADYNKISPFAGQPVLWAIQKKLISGRNGAIAPQGEAQRCEIAQIMYNNYLKKVVPIAKLCVHSYSQVSCTDTITCLKCGNDTVLGHNYIAGKCNRLIGGRVCNELNTAYCPKFYFTGNMSDMTTKKDIREIAFEYQNRDQKITGSAKIKLQGTSSLGYLKKNYTINFYQNSSFSNKMKVDVGWGPQTEYCLKANWIDKTHSRNVVTAKLVGEMQSKYGLFNTAPNNGAIDGFPIEVYINGQFHGLYTMNIPKDAWMFNMDTDNPNHIVVGGENWSDPVLFKSIPTNLNDWAVEVGPENDETLKKVQRLVDFVLNSSDQEFKANFDKYLNLDATLNYYVMMNYGWMPDNTGKNMLLATYDGKVWYPSLYDLDTSWGTYWNGSRLYDYESNLLDTGDSLLWQRVEKLYAKEIAERYFELRADVLDTTHVMETFWEFHSRIPQEVFTREKQRWNTEETPIPGYEIPQIQHYLDSVVPRLDAKYSSWR